MTKKFTNKELMEKIVELRTLICNKRNSTDGSVELLEEYLMVLEEEAKERIKVTRKYQGDTDGDEKESPKSKYIITLL